MLCVIITQPNTTVTVVWLLSKHPLPPALIFRDSLTLPVTVMKVIDVVGGGLCADWSGPGIVEGVMQKLRLLLRVLHFSCRVGLVQHHRRGK